MTDESINQEIIENKPYELAYLLVRELTDELAVATVTDIVKHIESLGGKLLAQDGPEMRELAYSVTRTQTGKKTEYTHAYFGWVRFELSAKEQLALKLWLATNKNILRSMTMSVSRSTPTAPLRRAPRRPSIVKTEAPVPELSSAEIDEQVERLIATTEKI